MRISVWDTISRSWFSFCYTANRIPVDFEFAKADIDEYTKESIKISMRNSHIRIDENGYCTCGTCQHYKAVLIPEELFEL